MILPLFKHFNAAYTSRQRHIVSKSPWLGPPALCRIFAHDAQHYPRRNSQSPEDRSCLQHLEEQITPTLHLPMTRSPDQNRSFADPMDEIPRAGQHLSNQPRLAALHRSSSSMTLDAAVAGAETQ